MGRDHAEWLPVSNCDGPSQLETDLSDKPLSRQRSEPRYEHSNAATIQAYEATADLYLTLSPAAPDWLVQFMDQFVARLRPAASILELGSGPGRDADLLEARGLTVTRSDAAVAFLDLMHARGVTAHKLNLLTDGLGGPWSGIYANAVLLHLCDNELREVLLKIVTATSVDGLLAFTVKEGDGSAWTTDKILEPRFFQYWREPALRSLLVETGWEVLSVDHAVGRSADWLLFICRPGRPSGPVRQGQNQSAR